MYLCYLLTNLLTFSFIQGSIHVSDHCFRTFQYVPRSGFSLPVRKKPEVSEKGVYRISRKIIGFAILISDEI
jgi:hypothetical protein